MINAEGRNHLNLVLQDKSPDMNSKGLQGINIKAGPLGEQIYYVYGAALFTVYYALYMFFN